MVVYVWAGVSYFIDVCDSSSRTAWKYLKENSKKTCKPSKILPVGL